MAFLEDLEAASEIHGVQVHACALLPNHFHLLIQTPRGNMSAFMQALQTRYGVFFNRRHRKSGHVFQGPYKGVLVEEDEYLLKLSRYIHLNPVRTKRFKGKPKGEVVRALRAYRWSSYRAYAGLARREKWMCHESLESQVLSRFGKGRGTYRRYVESGLAESEAEWRELLAVGGMAVGSAEFLEEVRDRYQALREGSGRKAEDVSLRNERRAVPAEEVIRVVCEVFGFERGELLRRRGGAPYRGMAARMLVRYGGLTQRQAAAYLGVCTGAAISIRIREAERRLETDGAWRRKDARMERLLSDRESS